MECKKCWYQLFGDCIYPTLHKGTCQDYDKFKPKEDWDGTCSRCEYYKKTRNICSFNVSCLAGKSTKTHRLPRSSPKFKECNKYKEVSKK